MQTLRNIKAKYKLIPIAARASVWFIICNLLQQGIAIITTPIFTRLLTTEQYGQYSVYISWLQIFTILTTLRLNFVVFSKGMSKFKENRNEYTSTMQSLTALLAIFVLAIYFIFQRQINELTELPTPIMLIMFAELTVSPSIAFWTIRERYEYIYIPVVICSLSIVILNASVGVCAVMLAEQKGIARILTHASINILFGAVLMVYNYKRAKVIFDIKYAKFAVLFNLPLLLHYFAQYVLDQFDRIMIQKLVGFHAAGIYSVAYSAGLCVKIVTSSINNALTPWEYDKLEKEDIHSIEHTLFRLFVFLAGCALLFSLVAPEAMLILGGKLYYDAVYVIPPVAVSMFFMFMYNTFANIEFYFDDNKFTMYISVVGAVLNIILNFVFIKTFGFVAAAYTTLACYVLFTVGHYLNMNRIVRKKGLCTVAFEPLKLSMLSLMTIILCVVVVMLYDYIYVRYILVLCIAVGMFVKRKKIISVLQTSKVKGKNKE